VSTISGNVHERLQRCVVWRKPGQQLRGQRCDLSVRVGEQSGVRTSVESGGLVCVVTPPGIDRDVDTLGHLLHVAVLVV
jgi:hypothetical protein